MKTIIDFFKACLKAKTKNLLIVAFMFLVACASIVYIFAFEGAKDIKSLFSEDVEVVSAVKE